MGPEGLVSYAWEHLAPTGALGSSLGSDRSSWQLKLTFQLPLFSFKYDFKGKKAQKDSRPYKYVL